MCGVNFQMWPPPPPLWATPKEVQAWLDSMAAWEAVLPVNVRARNKRKRWRRIHDYAARRYLDTNSLSAARFWHAIMMRAKAYEAKWDGDVFWELVAKEYQADA